ncbi:hypothetical protein SAMN05518846_12820 [Brevibacillus centrosporus]|uniref:Uncharacterized protein n=1 Tax=Brevibacillus centrosporus TaxID=54910 RepID=A0A1I4E2D1_9BACL|nr:hypothetical protein SAMN05518846_12820 [Brevibacillus centrosporus]
MIGIKPIWLNPTFTLYATCRYDLPPLEIAEGRLDNLDNYNIHSTRLIKNYKKYWTWNEVA